LTGGIRQWPVVLTFRIIHGMSFNHGYELSSVSVALLARDGNSGSGARPASVRLAHVHEPWEFPVTVESISVRDAAALVLRTGALHVVRKFRAVP
jgi:hypothetical protein